MEGRGSTDRRGHRATKVERDATDAGCHRHWRAGWNRTGLSRASWISRDSRVHGCRPDCRWLDRNLRHGGDDRAPAVESTVGLRRGFMLNLTARRADQFTLRVDARGRLRGASRERIAVRCPTA